jgi:hypothetical protein
VDTVKRTVAQAAIDNMNGTQTKIDLMIAMLVYGGYAQHRFSVDSNNPVYNLLTENGYEIPSIDNVSADDIDFNTTITDPGIGIALSEETPVMDAAIAERVYFRLDSGRSVDEYTFKVTIADALGRGELVTVEPVFNKSKNSYYVTIPDIPAAFIDYVYTVQVIENDSGAVYEVKTCVLSWIKAKLSDPATDPKIANLAKALYLYNQAANAHFKR